jgi:hypothetical protein
MRSLSLATGVAATAALLTLAAGAHVDARAGGSSLPLRTVARVPLSGAAVRFDYTSLDPRTNELWISHMDADRLLAARSGHILVDVQTRGELAIGDPRSNRIVRHLALRGCANPHGLLAEHPHGLTKLGQAMLAPHAHTVAVDPRTHLLYFPLESGSTGKPQLLIMAPT